MSSIATEDIVAYSGDVRTQSRGCLPISISLLGQFSAVRGTRTVEIRGLKQRALLAYLALSSTGTEARERIVGLLWSESGEERARGSLRQTLRSLRRVFDGVGFRGLRTDNFSVAIEKESIVLDVSDVLSEIEQRRVHPLLLNTIRLTESLLAGFEDADPAFRVWLLARRQALLDRLTRALEGGLHDPALDPGSRLRFAEALMNLDPTHEESCRHIMSMRAHAGDLAGSLKVYRTLWKLLDEEYDMEPSGQTQRLVAEIKNGGFSVPAAVERPGQTDSPGRIGPIEEPRQPAFPANGQMPLQRPSRLVLVVDPLSADGIAPDKRFILEGFRHHLISRLVRFREWQVAEAGAPVRQSAGGAPAAARYRIQTTAYQAGDAVGLIVSLKDEETGHFVWSDRLHLLSDNLSDLQRRIVQRITVALNVQLSADRLMRLAGQPHLPPELYDQWLVAQELAVTKRKPEDWERATGILQGLIRQAPGFGPAYSALVQLRNVAHIVHPGVFRLEARQRETLALAKTAVQLDPVDSRSQLCLGWAHAFAGQFDQALLHFGLACELNDTDPWTLTSSAHAHAFAGDFATAKELAEKARDVALIPAPMHWAYNAIMCFMWGDYEACLAAADRSNDIAPVTPMWRAAALFQLGRAGEARREAERFLNFIRSRWPGAEPNAARIGDWIMQLFPIRHAEDRERVRQALAGAGFPVATTPAG